MSASINNESYTEPAVVNETTTTSTTRHSTGAPCQSNIAMDDGNSTDALADSFSSSLASIAAAGRTNHYYRNFRNTGSTVTHSDESQPAMTTGTTSTRTNAPMNRTTATDSFTKHEVSVTANTTTNSSDDRGDSSEVDTAMKINLFDYTTCHRRLCHAAKSIDINDEDERPHYHRNHHRRLQQQQQQAAVVNAVNASNVPAQHADGAAMVVAPLPTPSTHMPVPKTHHATTTTSSSDDSNAFVTNRITTSHSALLHPYRESSFTNIRQTFHKAGMKRRTNALLLDDSSVGDWNKRRGLKRRIIIKSDIKETKASLLQARLSLLKHDRSSSMNDVATEDSSGMNSASEGGYSASYSSNGSCAADYYDSCNNSLNGDDDDDDDSTDDFDDTERRNPDAAGQHHQSGDPMRPMLSKKYQQDAMSTSSEIADFSSNFYSSKTRSHSPSITSSPSSIGSGDDDGSKEKKIKVRRRRRTAPAWTLMSQQSPTSMIIGDCSDSRNRFTKRARLEDLKPAAFDRMMSHNQTKKLDGKIPIMALDCDVLAHVLTFLEPPEVLDVLTMPLSKGWLSHFTSQPELWRVLCLLEPFKAQINEDDDSSGMNSSSSYSSDDDSIFLHSSSAKRSSKFRLLYASYIRCMRCLARIKEDAISGKPLSMVDYAAVLEESGMLATTSVRNFGTNQNLQQFLARARTCTRPNTTPDDMEQATSTAPTDVSIPAIDHCNAKYDNIKATDVVVGQGQVTSKKTRVKFGHSKLTQRLVGPALNGRLGEVELPWSYGIYSIVNWMVAYFDVEGIQIMCLRVLPFLLENEQQRITAQRAGLTDIVLRDMVLFPESVMLHTSAFHTIVLLARPLGGQEGMLFHTSMVNSSGIFGSSSESAVGGRSGIAVLIDSMRRFGSDEALQSMACWSLVNIALAPAQKEVLVKLGGIEVIAQAMVEHQYSAEVQFRALFALINLVIPSVPSNNSTDTIQHDLGMDVTEREMLDEMVDQIVGLVVLSMKNYCANEAILNRACLVLHNLSLSPCYHTAMLWTPNCYQMLEWCLGNYRTDQVLQQSAAGTLHRLQATLSRDEPLRIRFAANLQDQQKAAIDRANQDAIRMKERQQQQQDLEIAELSVQLSID